MTMMAAIYLPPWAVVGAAELLLGLWVIWDNRRRRAQRWRNRERLRRQRQT